MTSEEKENTEKEIEVIKLNSEYKKETERLNELSPNIVVPIIKEENFILPEE